MNTTHDLGAPALHLIQLPLRLRTVTRKSDSALIATYSYDANNRRTRKLPLYKNFHNNSTISRNLWCDS